MASPYRDARPPGSRIELVVIHAISLPPGQFGGPGIIDFFCGRLDPAAHPYYAAIAALKVSAHFLVRRDGKILQFVPCGARAWHAGKSAWGGREQCNDFSLGIELEGTDDMPFEAVQYETLASLVRTLQSRYPIADVVGHADIAPDRKTDPGPNFDWKRFRALLEMPR